MSNPERGDGVFKVIASTYPFENLVALDVRWPGNRLGRKFPVDLLLEVEEHQLTVPIKQGLLQRLSQGLSGQTDTTDQVLRLRVRLRHCYVRYRSNEVDVLSSSKYEFAIVEGKFAKNTSTESRELTASQRHIGLAAKASLKPTEVGASLDTRVGAALTRQATHTTEEITAEQAEIFEVQAVPNGWRVGHPDYGDPNKASHCLDGRYFHRPVPGFPQTCEMGFRERNERGTVTFIVTIRDGLHVERVGGGIAGASERIKTEAAMRDRIAALRLERHLAYSEGHETRADAEIPIAVVTCEIAQAADDEAADMQAVESPGPTLAKELIDSPIARQHRSRPMPP